MEGINFNAVLLLTKEVPALGTVQSVCAAFYMKLFKNRTYTF